MEPGPDDDVLYRAVVSRDARFEGRFVVAVRTTGIYCRPGCPAPLPKRMNVRFFSCPAAAEQAGFRPCRRCRPDAAPGSPAWQGAGATVSRALRLVDECPEGASTAWLAAQLGVGERHLRRLFRERVGTSPRAVAHTRRVHFARQLIDETELSFAEVAASAGFASVRRFNEAVRATFGRAPSELRRRPSRAGGLTLRLPYRPPLDWALLIDFLRARAIPGVEEIDGAVYRRTVATEGGGGGVIEVAPLDGDSALGLTVTLPSLRGLDRLVARVRRLFDLDADPIEIGAALARDPRLGRAVRARPGVRVPGAWEPFELAVRAVLGQQVSVAGARTLAGRLVQACGAPVETPHARLTHLFPSPAELGPRALAGLAVPRARAAALAELAARFADGRLPPHGDLEQVVAALTAVPGIGPWTAHYIAMRALGEPDACPLGDLGLARALGVAPARVAARAEAWRPWRAYAAMYLWMEAGMVPRKERA